MAKEFRFSDSQLKPFVGDRGTCLASHLITVEGHKVGYMYRDEPNDDHDSGWQFMAGTESEAYMDDLENVSIHEVNVIAYLDPDIIPVLDAPIGAAFARNPHTGAFEREAADHTTDPYAICDPETTPNLDTSRFAQNQEAGAPDGKDYLESSAMTGRVTVSALPSNPDFCDGCGRPLEPGEYEVRSKTKTHVAGAAAFHTTVNLALCRQCAESHDSTSNIMAIVLALFVGTVVAVGLGGWLFSLVVR